MKTKFNHAANDSPRSGSSTKVTPVAWFLVIAVCIAIVSWFAVNP